VSWLLRRSTSESTLLFAFWVEETAAFDPGGEKHLGRFRDQFDGIISTTLREQLATVRGDNRLPGAIS